MKDRKKHIFTTLLIVLVIAAVVFAVFKSEAGNKETTVLSETYNGKKLKIIMVDTPEKPYGETNCRADLYEKGKKTAEQSIAVQNDGDVVTKDNFHIYWYEDVVSIVVSGVGQEDTVVTISYGLDN